MNGFEYMSHKNFIGKEGVNPSTIYYEHITKWWDSGKLNIKDKEANDWLSGFTENKIKQITAQNQRKEDNEVEVGNAQFQERYYKYLIRTIQEKNIFYGFYGIERRFYNNLTGLPEGLLNYIQYDSQSLVNIKIGTSLPFFSLPLFSKQFWDPSIDYTKSLAYISKNIYYGIQETIFYSIIMKLLNRFENDATDFFNVGEYKSIVLGGKFYENIKSKLTEHHHSLLDTIDDVRYQVAILLYTDPCSRFISDTCETFRSNFFGPNKLFDHIKSENFEDLAGILMRIESYLIIDKICKIINQLNPNIPLFTRHNSIITTKENETIVKEIMKKEIVAFTGYTPILHSNLLEPKGFDEHRFDKRDLVEYR